MLVMISNAHRGAAGSSLVLIFLMMAASHLHSDDGTPPSGKDPLSIVNFQPGTGVLRLTLPESIQPGGDVTTGRLDTAFGAIRVNKDLPATPGDAAWIFRALDTQFATQAYLWALPIVAYAEWKDAQSGFGATGTDLVVYSTYEEKLGILTANPATTYAMAFTNLAETGPLVLEIPPGALAGGIGDFWQRTISEIGEGGRDQGLGGKYILIPPGESVPEALGNDYLQISCERNNVRIGFRAVEVDPTVARAHFSGIRIYPYTTRNDPAPTRVLSPGGEKWYGGQPRGLAYWERLHSALQDDPVDERDRFYMAMLRELGIEKGKAFTPDFGNKRILLEGVKSGELIAKTISFSSRLDNSRHWPDRRWEHSSLVKNTEQREDHHDQLLERSASFYESFSRTNGAVAVTPGVGQSLIAAYTDKYGGWLDGGKKYQLRIPPHAPVKQAWAIALYDMDTRCFIENEKRSADLSSWMDLQLNDDDSITLYFGPAAPPGKERNWVQTMPGRLWFTYFRLHGPLEPFFDKSWRLADIEPVKQGW